MFPGRATVVVQMIGDFGKRIFPDEGCSRPRLPLTCKNGYARRYSLVGPVQRHEIALKSGQPLCYAWCQSAATVPLAAPGINLAAGNRSLATRLHTRCSNTAAQASRSAPLKPTQIASATHHRNSHICTSRNTYNVTCISSKSYDEPQRRNRIPSRCYCCTVARDERGASCGFAAPIDELSGLPDDPSTASHGGQVRRLNVQKTTLSPCAPYESVVGRSPFRLD